MTNILKNVNNNVKTVVGIISLIACLVLFYMKPPYIEWYMILFLIPAIGLIVPRNDIKNSRILALITFILVILVLYVSYTGYTNAYHIMTNLYLTNQISHVPTATEIGECTGSYLWMMIYSIWNIIVGVLYLIPTSDDEEF